MNLNKVIFENSNLINTFFNKTPLRNIDFTTCQIAGISLEINDIKGAVVNAMQGLELTKLLELDIQ